MFEKKICLTIAMTLPLFIIGCGGGGVGSESGSKSSSSQSGLENGTRYYMLNHDLEGGDDNLIMEYEEVWNKQIKEDSSSTALSSYILTEKKLYQPSDIAVNIIDLNSMNSWTYTYIGDVKADIRLTKIDLSGKNMFDAIFPAYRNLGFDASNNYTEAKTFLNQYGNLTFPEGSVCYQFVSRKNRQESYEFTADEVYNQAFEDFKIDNLNYADYLNSIFNQVGRSYRYVSGTWQGIPWTSIYETNIGAELEDAVAVQFQNNTYLAHYNSNIEWTTTKEIKQWENLRSLVTTEDQKREANIHIARLKQSCNILNDTAAKALVDLKSINWNF